MGLRRDNFPFDDSPPRPIETMAAEVINRNVRVAKMDAALRMGIQLAESGGHDGMNRGACPTCHFVRVAREALEN